MTETVDIRQCRRSIEELAEKAVRQWPRAVTDAEAAISILPRLLETQDKFISILKLSDSSPDAWKRLVDISNDMPANLFLKHLMVLTNFGGETLGKITPFDKHFPNGQMLYLWGGQEHLYSFQSFVGKSPRAGSVNLRVDGKSLQTKHPLTSRMEDIAMFLLYASTSVGDNLAQSLKDQCVIGDLLGKPSELDEFVRQNYIRISRQIAGATNNTLGQLAQGFVAEALKNELPEWTIHSNGTLPGVSVNEGRTDAAFDVVAISPDKHYFGIEVSFQFTGNSVIERKARDAQALQTRVHAQGHHICYVIDGAGNIDIRRSAVSTICRYSDCTIAFSPEEIRFLAQCLRAMAEKKD